MYLYLKITFIIWILNFTHYYRYIIYIFYSTEIVFFIHDCYYNIITFIIQIVDDTKKKKKNVASDP